MLGNYLPILLFLITAIVIGGVAMAAGRLLGPNKPDAAKLSPYECGFEAFENTRHEVRRPILSCCHFVYYFRS